ncbi:MAG: zinc-dependent alcohol dehydrogenase family protein [Hyphomonadaceae bacterium]
MAKIVRFHETGGPEVLRLEEGDPGKPGPGHALVKIDAIGLNRGEAAFRGGHYIVKPTLPSVIGSEASGRIVAVGDGVKDFKPGDAVFTIPTFPTGQYGVCATETVLPVSALVKLPDGLDPIQSAATWVAFLTAYGGLVDQGKIAKDAFVLITAASSSVGLAAIQIARDQGAVVIAATRGRAKVEAIAKAGAAHVIATDEQDIEAEVMRITGGKGVGFIFDPVAGPQAEKLFALLSDGGELMIYGGMANQPHTFPRQLSIRKNLTMRGYSFFPLLMDKQRFAAAYDYILDRVRDGRFVMPVDSTFPLERVADAHRALEANKHIGKIVITT